MDDCWKTIRKNLQQMAKSGNVYAAYDLLLSENARRGKRRCTGNVGIDGDGVPTLGYCGKWTCWRCATKRQWVETRRIVTGANHYAERGDLWFVTLHYADTNRDTSDDEQRREWRKKSDRLIYHIRRKATRAGYVFEYVHVTGFKPTSGQIHSHLLCTWIPDVEPSPTRNHPNRYRSAWIEKRAANVGLSVWIERAENAVAVAKYSAKNIASTIHVDLPRNFYRVAYSHGWRQLPLIVSDEPNTDALIDFAIHVLDGVVTPSSADDLAQRTCNRLFCLFDGGEPLNCAECPENHAILLDSQSYVNFVQTTVSDVSTNAGRSTYTPTTQNRHKPMPSDGNQPSVATSIDDTQSVTKQCSSCGERYPITEDYWQMNRSNSDGLSRRCKQCERRRDKRRNRQPKRRNYLKAKAANQRAAESGIAGRITGDDVQRAFDATSGACFWCFDELEERWHIDHVEPLFDGGENVAENIVACCPRCNAKKATMSSDEWVIVLAGLYGIRHPLTPSGVPMQITMF